jgi:hypothetical protein
MPTFTLSTTHHPHSNEITAVTIQLPFGEDSREATVAVRFPQPLPSTDAAIRQELHDLIAALQEVELLPRLLDTTAQA